jgi:hypothetical protein
MSLSIFDDRPSEQPITLKNSMMAINGLVKRRVLTVAWGGRTAVGIRFSLKTK